MKGMTRKALQMALMFGVLVQPVTAEEPTTVESLLPVDLPPPVTDGSGHAARPRHAACLPDPAGRGDDPGA